jgi:hypothetical protein
MWLSLCLVVGLCFPTSVGGEISKLLGYCCAITLFALYCGLFLTTQRVVRPGLLICSLAINAALLLATLLSPLSGLALGAYMFYFLLSCLYLIDLREVRLGPAAARLFTIASVVLLILAAASSLRLEPVNNFFVDNYSAFYAELVPSMFRLGKPVLMFGSHSLAAFFFYLFFLLNFLTYARRESGFHFALAVCFLFVSLLLQSLTAYACVIAGVLQVLIYFGIHHRAVLRACSAVLLLGIVGVLAASPESRDALWSATSPLFTSKVNGLAARYTSVGTLAANIDYIVDNPFTPVGLRYSDQLWFVDSGPVEYMLRGSVLLVAAIYTGFYLFLKTSLHSARHCVLLCLVYFAFEVGFGNLVYLRTLYLLPFIVTYANSLASPATSVDSDTEDLELVAA